MQLFVTVTGVGSLVSGRINYAYWAVFSGVLYFLGCQILGFLYHRYEWAQANNDIGNYFNPLLLRVDRGIKKLIK